MIVSLSWLNENWKRTVLYFRHRSRCQKLSRIKLDVVLLERNGRATHHGLVPQASQDTLIGDLPESLNWNPSYLKTTNHPSHTKFIRMNCLLLLFCMHSTGNSTRWESFLTVLAFSLTGYFFQVLNFGKYWFSFCQITPCLKNSQLVKKTPKTQLEL